MKHSARTLLTLAGLSSLATVPLTACQDLASDCHFDHSCPEYADGEQGGNAGDSGDGDGDGDGDNTGGRAGGGDGDGDGDGDTGGGGTTSEPCDGACEGKKPECDEDKEECVECWKDEHCDAEGDEPVCDRNAGKCVGCLVSDDCDAESAEPVCESDAKLCVECMENDDCTDDAAPACDTKNYTCEECVVDADCMDPTMPMCGDDNLCAAGCTESTECARFAEDDAGVCDAVTGGCVECTVAEDDRTIDTDACETGVCLPGEQTCDDGLLQGATGTCRACIADNQCATDHDCVPMHFEDDERGGYCLKNNAGGCERPYVIDIAGETTLSGVSGETYCGINQTLTTCEAVRALLADDTCSENSECPEGGLCRKVGSLSGRCTYACSGAVQCDESPNPGSTCGAGVTPDPVTPDYCGGQ